MTRNKRKTEIRCPGRPGPKDHLKPFPYVAKVYSGVATEEQLTTLRNHANNRPAYRFATLDNQIDGKRDHSHLHGWELSDDRDLDSGNRRSYRRNWSQGEKTARKDFWNIMQVVFREAGLPSDMNFLDGAGATSPEFFETYWVERPTMLRTLLGAEDQRGHGDLNRHEWLWDEKKGLQLSCILPVQHERRVTFVMGNGRMTELVVQPGDVLLFRADHCHYGNGYGEEIAGVTGRFADRIAIHAFLLCHEEKNLGRNVDSSDCGGGVTNTLTQETLANPELFPGRTVSTVELDGEPREWGSIATTEESPCRRPSNLSNVITDSAVCQLCRCLQVEHEGQRHTGRRSGLVHCKDCRLVLCRDICFDNFHSGLGLPCWIDRGMPAHCHAKAEDIRARLGSAGRTRENYGEIFVNQPFETVYSQEDRAKLQTLQIQLGLAGTRKRKGEVGVYQQSETVHSQEDRM